MKFKNKVKDIMWISAIMLFFIGLIVPFIMRSSKNFKISFLGQIISSSSLMLIMLGFGIYNLKISKDKNEKSSVKTRTKIIGVVLIIFSITIGVITLPYYKDIPNMMNSKYEAYDGQLKDVKVIKGRTTITKFTVGDKEFELNGQSSKNFLVKGKKYHVEVLPNTNYVVSVYRY
jgi:hypothetical protein